MLESEGSKRFMWLCHMFFCTKWLRIQDQCITHLNSEQIIATKPPKTIQVIFFLEKIAQIPSSIHHLHPHPHYQGPCPDCGTFSLPSATRARNAATNGQGMVLESGWCLWGATRVDRVGRLPNPDDPCMDYLLTLGAKWLHSILPSWSIWATRA